jgi:hypothetical protein
VGDFDGEGADDFWVGGVDFFAMFLKRRGGINGLVSRNYKPKMHKSRAKGFDLSEVL